MPGVYCPRCETNVHSLEQDGKSCPNCGRVLVTETVYRPELEAKARAAAESKRAGLQQKDMTARRRLRADKAKTRKLRTVTVPPDDQDPPPEPKGDAAA